jgi:hypothetical protein
MSGKQSGLNDVLRIRADIEAFVDQLIQALDRLDSPDEELEDTDEDDDEILEPSLGATEHIDQRKSWQRNDLYAPDLEGEFPTEAAVLFYV